MFHLRQDSGNITESRLNLLMPELLLQVSRRGKDLSFTCTFHSCIVCVHPSWITEETRYMCKCSQARTLCHTEFNPFNPWITVKIRKLFPRSLEIQTLGDGDHQLTQIWYLVRDQIPEHHQICHLTVKCLLWNVWISRLVPTCMSPSSEQYLLRLI